MTAPHRVNVLIFAVAVTGMIMMAATLLAQTGHASNSGRWTYPRDLSPSGNAYTIEPDLAVDGQGQVHVIWVTNTVAPRDVLYAMSTDAGGSWPTTHLFPLPDDAANGSLAVEADGTAHVAWIKPGTDGSLYYASGVGTGWDPPYPLDSGGEMLEPAIAVANGIRHITFSYDPPGTLLNCDLYYKKHTGTTWLDSSIISDTEYTSFSSAVAADRRGDLHVVWQESADPWDILYISGTVSLPSTAWSSSITVSADIISDTTDPDIAVSGDDVVHVLFGTAVTGTEHSVYHAAFPISDAGAMSPTEIPGSLVDISQMLPSYPSPSVAVDESGTVHVVWNGGMEGDHGDRIYYSMSEDQGATWSYPFAISRNDPYPDGFATIATDGTVLHVAWQQEGLSDDDQHVYYSRHFPLVRILPLAFKNYP